MKKIFKNDWQELLEDESDLFIKVFAVDILYCYLVKRNLIL